MGVFSVPNLKVTLKINYASSGWSETFYSVPYTDGSLPAVVTAVTALCQARAACLDGKQGAIIDAEWSQDNVNRDVWHLDPAKLPVASGGFFPGGPNVGDYKTSGWAYESPHISWPILMKTQLGYVNPILYVAGMPHRDSQFGPLPSQSDPFTVEHFLTIFATQLVGSGWGALARSWEGAVNMVVNGAPVYTPAAAGVPASFTFPLANIVASPYLAPGGFVRLKTAKARSAQVRLRFNGTYPIIGVNPGGTPPTITVACPRVLIAPTWTQFGYLQMATPVVAPYVTPQYRPFTHRKRGRPTETPRGRR